MLASSTQITNVHVDMHGLAQLPLKFVSQSGNGKL